jgi:hypothetical protein
MGFFTRLFFICFLVASTCYVSAQTVGLFHNDQTSFNGLTLFSSYAGDTTYLIDNCGRLVHEWQSAEPTARTPVHLLPNGNLVRSAKSHSTIFPGGGSGAFEMLDWNSSVIWSYDVTDTMQSAHHDYKVMPNGNILAVLWEVRTAAEFIAHGGNPANSSPTLWPDKIMELTPIGTDTVQVIWEWKAWDHMIQDFDATKSNYGVVADHPELMDINVLPTVAGSWLHTNSIDYNPALDQILIGLRNISEFWIIDHSTSTAQAATHSGGNSGMGGDILYRWGNPANYDRGTAADQKLFQQHDAQWIKPGFPNAGKILVFNNGLGRPQGAYSSVEIIKPPLSANNYALSAGLPFGPASSDWIYPSTLNSNFYSATMGGATVQPNGNILICEGNSGEFTEVDSTGIEVWKYVSPVTTTGILTQGSTGNNGVFKFYRYPPEYPAFTGHMLVPGLPIEVNPLPNSCMLYPTAIPNVSADNRDRFTMYPNPARDQVTVNIDAYTYGTWELRVYSMSGKVLKSETFSANKGSNQFSFAVNELAAGTYMVQANSGKAKFQVLLTIQ